MMDYFRDFLTRVLSTKHAWILLLLGLASLALIWFLIWPFDKGEVITAPLAGALTLLGLVTLAVNAGAVVVGKVRSRVAERRDAREAAQATAALDSEALLNLNALTEVEELQLRWILQGTNQRVDLPVAYGLIEKHILISIGHSLHIVHVREAVWRRRHEYLQRWPRPIGGAFPATGRWVV